jgi:hypothetical protein
VEELHFVQLVLKENHFSVLHVATVAPNGHVSLVGFNHSHADLAKHAEQLQEAMQVLANSEFYVQAHAELVARAVRTDTLVQYELACRWCSHKLVR